MKFGLFYEIPVARPRDKDSELRAYQEVLEQAVLGDRVGFHAFWTVEHHFLDEFSHCSNPEVLYGAVAARTE
ncbi:MAG: LLM class flavin-dependent oxidoreductase, partial [Myxococcota bacterium]